MEIRMRQEESGMVLREQKLLRESRLLNNGWKFIYGYREPDQTEDYETWPDIGLPHSFGIPYFMENEFYVGYGCYWRELELSAEDIKKRLLLEFLGVFQCAEVYLNGQLAEKHEGGYTSFVADLTGRCREGKNELFVRVNNLWNPRLAPRAGEHQFNGGIYRDVSLILSDQTCVEWMGTFVRTRELKEDGAWVEAEISIRSSGELENKGGRLVTEIRINGETAAKREQCLEQKNQQTIFTEFYLRQPKLWSPEHPVLYKMINQVFCGTEKKDEYVTVFGVRTVRFDKDTGFYLNGKPYKILGANVHQDHAGWADAVTRAGITRDIEMIKECGMNFIRGSHYPHHPFFAEECDRIGILFWSELCYWGTGGLKEEGYWTSSAYPVHLEDQKPFEDSCLRALEEMILVNRNHPSVIIWSVCNEPFFCDEAVMQKSRDLVKKLTERVHELDPSRKAAVGGAQRGGFDALGDVAGYNGDGASLYLNPGFPNFVSEYGSMVSWRPGVFSPNFREGVENDYPWRSGKALWCGFHHGSILGNMGAMGMIDYYRLPLNTWYWYRENLRGIPAPERPESGAADHLELTADRLEFLANGQEDTWICVQAVDRQGRRLSNEFTVTLRVAQGDGIFPTGQSITFSPEENSFLDGQAAIEFRSYYGGKNVIEAYAEGLPVSRICIRAVGEARSRKLIPMERAPYLSAAPISENVYDLAQNRPVFASSSQKGYEPYVVTEKGSSCWIPEQEENAWIKLDLEGEKEITGIEITFAGESEWKVQPVYLSSDDLSYEPLELRRQEQAFVRMERKKTRFVKILWSSRMQGVQSLRIWAVK